MWILGHNAIENGPHFAVCCPRNLAEYRPSEPHLANTESHVINLGDDEQFGDVGAVKGCITTTSPESPGQLNDFDADSVDYHASTYENLRSRQP
jgi:hypothetical protein